MNEELIAAAKLLSPEYCRGILALNAPIEDIRLRLGRPIGYRIGTQEYILDTLAPFGERDLLWTLEKATNASLYAVQDTLRHGYIHTSGGIRIGVCGTGVIKNGETATLKEISSLSIRVARACRGAADRLLPYGDDGSVENTLIVSPPGYGKTSLLRDMIRQISNRGVRVCVADERGEIAAMQRGQPGFDVGVRTDVLDGVDKLHAVMMLIKTMSPQVLALDEISEACDARAVEIAANNGISILATIHGRDPQDLYRRPVLESILQRKTFDRVIVIGIGSGGRIYRNICLRQQDNYAA